MKDQLKPWLPWFAIALLVGCGSSGKGSAQGPAPGSAGAAPFEHPDVPTSGTWTGSYRLSVTGADLVLDQAHATK